MLVDASVKGYTKWLSTQEENDPQQNEHDRSTMLQTFVSYFEYTLPLELKDPAVQRRILSSLTHMAMRLFQKTRPDLGTQLLDRLLNLQLSKENGNQEYEEASKALSFLAVSESQKLASVWADNLISSYDTLEQRVGNKVREEQLDAAHELGYQNFLFTIVLHATSLDENTKYGKLRDMANNSTSAWQTPEFDAACKDFASFYGLMGLGGLPEYLYAHGFHKLQDWSEHMLDEEGRRLQAHLNEKVDHIPHRATRMLLMATFDKLPPDSPNMELVLKLWSESMPAFLPNLMQTLRHAHMFGDQSSWPNLPPEMHGVIARMLTDRFWQAGISNESMDDFYKRVNASKHSYEGFASSIRGAIRQIREKSYSILCYLTRLEGGFYALPELPTVLAENVYATARSLSAHQWSVLLNMSDQLIRGCPVELRNQFLPAVLVAMLGGLEEKLRSEWEVAVVRSSKKEDGEDLGDEMKRESILRMLTYHAVVLVNGLVDIGMSACTTLLPFSQLHTPFLQNAILTQGTHRSISTAKRPHGPHTHAHHHPLLTTPPRVPPHLPNNHPPPAGHPLPQLRHPNTHSSPPPPHAAKTLRLPLLHHRRHPQSSNNLLQRTLLHRIADQTRKSDCADYIAG